jgi:hypothetical protein
MKCVYFIVNVTCNTRIIFLYLTFNSFKIFFILCCWTCVSYCRIHMPKMAFYWQIKYIRYSSVIHSLYEVNRSASTIFLGYVIIQPMTDWQYFICCMRWLRPAVYSEVYHQYPLFITAVRSFNLDHIFKTNLCPITRYHCPAFHYITNLTVLDVRYKIISFHVILTENTTTELRMFKF